MPSNYTGVATAIAPGDAITVTNPLDGDGLTATSNNAATQTLANATKSLLESAVLKAGAQTITGDKSFNGALFANAGVTVPSTQDFKYSPSRSFSRFFSGRSFRTQSPPGAAASETTYGSWRSASAGGYVITADLDIPQGAVITFMHAVVRSAVSSITLTFRVIRDTITPFNASNTSAALASGLVQANVLNADAGSGVAVAFTGTSPTIVQSYLAVAALASTSPSAFIANVTIPGTTSDNDIEFYGLNVQYTLAVLKP